MPSLREANRRGEFLEAFNIADQALHADPDSLELAYAAVLALARTGATHRAERRYDELRLWERAQDAKPTLSVDILALRGRLQKDRARQSAGGERIAALLAASRTYETVFRNGGDPFPGVNAATLAFLAGERDKARRLAKETATALERSSNGKERDYYFYATRAEIALLRGDLSALETALGAIASGNLGDEAARSSTRRQLREICRAAGIDPSVLRAIEGRAVVHFTGHIFEESFDERALAADIRAKLDDLHIGFAFGSLAAGADIVFAEAALERGAALHVVLPFKQDEFRRVSVTAFGTSWGERFDRAIARAQDVSYATEDAYLGDDVLFAYASNLAMGIALLRAQTLDTRVVQIAMVDRNGSSFGTTGGDVRTWQEGARQTIFIHVPRTVGASTNTPERATPRVLRAMLFGDVRGFSKLREAQLPVFVDNVLGRFARVLARHAASIEFRNTWGDGLYVVMKDAASAAKCALDLQAEVSALSAESVGLPADMGLRLGVHFGPVFPVHDPVMRAPGFMGAHVSRTARLEPVTPEGAVYVTEPFAAAILLESPAAYTCEYVGRIPAAKDYGRLAVYALTPNGQGLPDNPCS